MVHSLWADEQVYYPVEFEPYTPKQWFDKGDKDPQFRSKPAIALELVRNAVAQDMPFRAVVADSFYGENDSFRDSLHRESIPYVLALYPSYTWWHKVATVGSVEGIARSAPWCEEEPAKWHKLTRHFRDGHEETWWVLEGEAGPYGVEKPQRLVIATTDPTTLPDLSTGYLVTNLPAPESTRAEASELEAADLAEIVRLYGLRIWVEQSYKQLKQHLGWAEYQVRKGIAMRRHWQLVCCAFSFCCWALAYSSEKFAPQLDRSWQPAPPEVSKEVAAEAVGEKNSGASAITELAPGIEAGKGLARALSHAHSLLAGMVDTASPRQLTQLLDWLFKGKPLYFYVR